MQVPIDTVAIIQRHKYKIHFVIDGKSITGIGRYRNHIKVQPSSEQFNRSQQSIADFQCLEASTLD